MPKVPGSSPGASTAGGRQGVFSVSYADVVGFESLTRYYENVENVQRVWCCKHQWEDQSLVQLLEVGWQKR